MGCIFYYTDLVAASQLAKHKGQRHSQTAAGLPQLSLVTANVPPSTAWEQECLKDSSSWAVWRQLLPLGGWEGSLAEMCQVSPVPGPLSGLLIGISSRFQPQHLYQAEGEEQGQVLPTRLLWTTLAWTWLCSPGSFLAAGLAGRVGHCGPLSLPVPWMRDGWQSQSTSHTSSSSLNC